MKKFSRIMAWVLASVFALNVATAATIVLKDGRKIEGDIVSNSNGVLVVNSNGIEMKLDASQVATVDMTGGTGAATAATAPAAAPAAPAPAPKASGPTIIPAGTQLKIAMRDTVSTSKAHAGQQFRAALQSNLRVDGKIIAPAGSQVFGTVVAVDKPGRMVGTGKLVIQLNQINVNGDLINIATNSVGYTGESTGKSTLGRTAGAAAIGGLIDGGSGARTGAKVGLGASLLTQGNHIAIQSGMLMDFQLQTNVAVQ